MGVLGSLAGKEEVKVTIGGVAALVQAVGSIAAIIAAFWIGGAQGRLAV